MPLRMLKTKKVTMGTNISFTTTEGPDATQFDTTDTAELLELFHNLLVESDLTLVSVDGVETVEVEVD